ncbi:MULTISPECIES: nitrilase family protein [Achromobacter]|jgi:predicted amidohydrolase|uniref:N-carbamoyl-D-amino acid hydrolase n=1 Tax=Achromobacter aegrifaciens TaxID=1287736 RepID=A0AAD2J2K2_ACHAE|nr:MULTISPECIES: nitrilase family protein [Achromobacter]MBD9379726.1 nitrilase family protein [Achromobacter sp. ACM02]MBD9473185.1 nitrilase family protein [Achromobacter sp. ACM01]MDQ1763377.1 nitrilase family protein [Achromobacter aegrifaciens]MDR7947279.1 nitrilase family protein [Achromobacter aegrifaciens]RIJ05273.1 hydratase [Achromobacter sp. K91]
MQASEPQRSPAAVTWVASVQMEPAIGETAANIARSIELVEQAAAQGARLVVLPELANTGYMFESREEAYALAEPVPEGPSSQAWIALAQRLGIYLVAGIAERAGGRLYNSALVAGPDGYLGTYRKLHLWGDENLYFEAGDLGLPVFDTELGRIGVAICYDGWFPEVYRLLAVRGADIVAVPTNWVPMPGQTRDGPVMAHALTMSGAHSNGLTVVCADRVGTERGQPFVGRSLIVGSQGWTAAGPASIDQEEVLLAPIDLKASRRARQLNDFNHVLRDRRRDIYDEQLGAAAGPRQR